MPTPVTPEEFWAFFKDNTTKLDISLLPVKAEDFLTQVKEQPTEKDLLPGSVISWRSVF